MRPIYARAGDVFFTRSNSLLGRAIRWAETDPGEEPTWANHTGVVVESGWIGGTADPAYVRATYDPNYSEAIVVEALWKTRRGPLKVNGIEVRVFRPKPPLDAVRLQRFRLAAGSHVGERYGWWRLLMHLTDRALFRGNKVVSRIAFVKGRPICSYLAAATFAVVGVTFGPVPPAAQTPDVMLDWVETHSEEWDEIK